MVSFRNFLSIMIMMAALLFMFQFSQIIREEQSQYDVNVYISEEPLSGVDRWRPQTEGTGMPEAYKDGGFVLLFTHSGSDIENVAKLWCQYTKRELLVCEGTEAYISLGEPLPEAVLVDSEAVDISEELLTFEKFNQRGVTLIFCNLPEPNVIRKNRGLMSLLGIQSVREEEIEVEGIHLFSGFLLGGESFYLAEREEDEKKQDLELNVPWYITVGNTKTYMVGILDELLEDEEAKNELFPGLIWRNGRNDTGIFVVNGSYISGMMGVGILDAMMYEAQDYFLYPVVNAQNITVANFPGLAGESDDRMMELYSRSTEGLLRDICWPELVSLARRNQFKLTCLMMAQYDYTDGVEPSGSILPFYLQQFKEMDSEAGLSLTRSESTELALKLQQDNEFFTSLKETYAYGALYAEEDDLEQLENALNEQLFLANVLTIASYMQENAPIVSYYNDAVTLQSITSRAEVHSYADDLRVKSVETALGYSNVMIDMHKILWPEGVEDQWENAAEGMLSNLDTYWQAFAGFDQTTLSESDARVRSFLNLDYSQRRDGNTIYLQLSGVEDGWFILRTHGERIVHMDGGEYRELEQDAYLIHAQQPSVELELEKSRGILQFDSDRDN